MAERIEDQLKKMLVDRMIMKMDPADIDENAGLIDYYGLDSVCVLEIVVGLEELFGVNVGDEELDINNFKSVVAIANYVRRHLAEKERDGGGTNPPA
mgnify:CR=1 FL=1